MNFYSDQIIAEIIKDSSLTNKIKIKELYTKIEDFKAVNKFAVINMSAYDIKTDYTTCLLEDKNNTIAFYCLDKEFSVKNSPSSLIFRKYKYRNKIQYCILFACTETEYRGKGYASKMMDGFIDRIRQENSKNKGLDIKIVLNSFESSVLFYVNYGFTWTGDSILKYPKLLNHEVYDEAKEYFIMELIITI